MEAGTVASLGDERALAADADFADLERLWYELEPPDGVRAELIDGEIIVSPTASVPHSTAVYQLTAALLELSQRNNWVIHTFLTTHIEATRERLIPDLMIAPKTARQFSDWELISSDVLLIAEVVSPSSGRRDREAKRRAYAQGVVPLYLLIDHFDEPPAVTLFSRPGPGGYQETQKARSGQPLLLPEPFGLTLDIARLLA